MNTNLPPIFHRFRDIAFDRSKIAIFGYPSCVQPSTEGFSCEYHHKWYIVKTRWFGLHFCCRKF